MLKKFLSHNIIWLLIGIILFLFFAYDMEYNRSFCTWLWLLGAILNILKYFANDIKNHEKPIVENIVNSNIVIRH